MILNKKHEISWDMVDLWYCSWNYGNNSGAYSYVGIFKNKKHFFKDFNKKLASVKDERNQSYITYDPEIILFVVIMKNVSVIVSMNRMINDFNNDVVIDNIAKSLGYDSLEEIPHYDTVNDFLRNLELSELEKIRDYMIRELLKKGR